MFKKISLMFVVCFLVATTVFASGAAQITTVQVTGNSQQEITPDIAKISLTINSINSNLEQAKNENTQISNQVFAKLKEQNIPDQQIKTEAYRIDSLYNYEGTERNLYLFWQMSNTVYKVIFFFIQ